MRKLPPKLKRLKRLYFANRTNAKRRGIDFLLTFEEWLKFWQSSGHLAKRGRGRGKYVLARFGDEGPYKLGNIKIITHGENLVEGLTGNQNALGHCHDDATLEIISAARISQCPPNLGNKGYHLSKETKAGIKAGLKAYWDKRGRKGRKKNGKKRPTGALQ